MSSDCSLVWNGRLGHMSCTGVRLSLREQPYVPGLAPWEEIDYDGGKRRHVMRFGHILLLSDAEAYLIQAWLHRWALSARAAVTPWDGRTERRRGDRRACALVEPKTEAT